MATTDPTSRPQSQERLLLESMLTLATTLLRVQMELVEVRAMLRQQSTAPAAPTETDAPSKTISRWLQYLNLAKSLWGLLVWMFGTKWGQALLSFLMPLVMSEIRWGWLIALVKRLLGFGA